MKEEAKISNEKILIVGLNWLGDSIMTMPAIQAYRRVYPEKRITILVKPALADLWPMNPAIDETMVCSGSIKEIMRISAEIRGRFSTAFILPRSFRSALIPFLGKIPRRIGPRGQWRSFFITKIVSPPKNSDDLHQQHECMAVFGQRALQNELPYLRISSHHLAAADAALTNEKKPWVGLIPGAARGPAKRWPENYFASLGIILRNKFKCNIVVFGSFADQGLCARITGAIRNGVFPASTDPSPADHATADPLQAENHTKGVINMAGRTSLPALAAFMHRCSAVIGNDSGGVHLAAAAGTAVIVIFGITDPAKTRPLGERVVVLQESVSASRDIPRHSMTAEKSLKNISPDMAAEAIRSFL